METQPELNRSAPATAQSLQENPELWRKDKCNRLLHPHLLPILVLQKARAETVKFPSDSEQRKTIFAQKMHNLTAKDRTPKVQNPNSEHLICNSSETSDPSVLVKALHLSKQKRLAQKQKLCSLYTGEEGTTWHLTQGARNSKDIINIFKHINQGNILYSFYYEQKSMLQDL